MSFPGTGPYVEGDRRYCVFVVFGRSQGKGSKRVMTTRTHRGESKFHVVDSNRNAAPWATRITEKARETFDAPLIRGAVAVNLLFVFSRPRGHYGTGKNAKQVKASAPRDMAVMPDIDKLARTVLDALVGVVIADDALVSRLEMEKVYGEPERLEVRLGEL